MKKDENPLQFSQQLEAFQTARKAKEVNEICKFDTLKESLKQKHLTLSRRMGTLRQKFLRQLIEEPEIAEEYIIQEKAQALQELAEFEQQAYDMQQDAPDNEFDTIAAIQDFRYQLEAPQQELKYLLETHSDAFAHELTALTEAELQKEWEQNEKTLQESLKKPGRLELPTEPPLKNSVSPPAPVNQEDAEKPEQKNAPEAEVEVQKNPEPEIIPEKKTSESSLIYFHSNSPSSDE